MRAVLGALWAHGKGPEVSPSWGVWVPSSLADSPSDHRLQRVVGSEAAEGSTPSQPGAAHGVPGVERGLLSLLPAGPARGDPKG